MRYARLLPLLLFTACSGLDTNIPVAAQISIKTDPANLFLANNSALSVNYFIVEASYAAVTYNIAPIDPTLLPALRAGDRVRLPFTSIAGFHKNTAMTVYVYWYTQGHADTIQRAVVELSNAP